MLRDHVEINPRHLELIRHAMLADTEHKADSTGGAGYRLFANFTSQTESQSLRNFRVAGKTGTAEVKSIGAQFAQAHHLV